MILDEGCDRVGDKPQSGVLIVGFRNGHTVVRIRNRHHLVVTVRKLARLAKTIAIPLHHQRRNSSAGELVEPRTLRLPRRMQRKGQRYHRGRTYVRCRPAGHSSSSTAASSHERDPTRQGLQSWQPRLVKAFRARRHTLAAHQPRLLHQNDRYATYG